MSKTNNQNQNNQAIEIVNSEVREDTIVGKKHQPRATCPICLKPALMYSHITPKGKKRLTFEHRDEPPIGEYMYRGNRVFRYRRCNGGIVSKEGLPLISEGETVTTGPTIKKKRGRPLKAFKVQDATIDWQSKYLELRAKFDVISNLIDGANRVCKS